MGGEASALPARAPRPGARRCHRRRGGRRHRLTLGATLAARLLRPLAEQLLDGLSLTPDTRILQLSGDNDCELARRLIGDITVAAPKTPLRRPDAGYDVALSLFGIAVDGKLLGSLTEIARVATTARILVWLDGATHEIALSRATGDAMPSRRSPAPGTTTLPLLPPGWSQREVIDVVRFDGIDQAWQALVTERAVALPSGTEAATRVRLAHHLDEFTAVDGTMRIPVRTTLLELRGS